MATAQEVLLTAAGEVGVTERPAGSNKVKYNTAYYGREVSGSAYPWCCAFVWWVFHRLGAEGLITKTASCTHLMNHFKGLGRLVEPASMRPGDLVFFQFDKDTYADHIGIVEQVNGKGFVTIEGNTSVTSNDNGGAVMRRNRTLSQVMAVARPAYAAPAAPQAPTEQKRGEENMDDKKAAPWAAAAWDKAKAAGVLDGTRPHEPATRQELAVALDRLGLLERGV